MDRLQYNIIIASISGNKRLVVFETTIINIWIEMWILEFDWKSIYMSKVNKWFALKQIKLVRTWRELVRWLIKRTNENKQFSV